METVDDLFYLKDEYNDGRYVRWYIKDDVKFQFNNALVPGDVVYFEYYSAKYIVSDLESYLSSIGCTRTKKIQNATKIVNTWDYTLTNYFSQEGKPKEVRREFPLRFKSVYWSSIETAIGKYLDGLRTRIEFDYNQYENLWSLFRSKSVENFRLAGMGTMTIDWTGNEFLLHMLIYQFQSQIRGSNFSNIPGWSNWANTATIDWKNHQVYAHQLMRLFKDYKITQEQFTIIHKLLNQ